MKKIRAISLSVLGMLFLLAEPAWAATKLPNGDKVLEVFNMLTTWLLYLAPGSVALLATYHTFNGIWGQTDVMRKRVAKDKVASVIKWGAAVFLIGGIVKAIIAAVK